MMLADDVCQFSVCVIEFYFVQHFKVNILTVTRNLLMKLEHPYKINEKKLRVMMHRTLFRIIINKFIS